MSMQEVTLRGENGEAVRVIVEKVGAAERQGSPPASHSADFASFSFRGVTYTFTPLQRSVVAALWRAREDGHDFLSNAELIEVCGSAQAQVYDLFRGHPAWRTLIVPGHECGGNLGTFRIAE